jgi:hypothetical protein
VAGKDKNFWKYVAQILTYISQIKTDVYKLEEAFVYWFVVRKNLSQFFEIHFHFPGYAFQKHVSNREILRSKIRAQR